jgi:Zn-dependent protease
MRAIRLGRIAGIPIGIQPLWVVIAALLAWSLGDTWFPDHVDGIAPAAAYALGAFGALLLFAGILLHEIGHAVVARRHGVDVEEIDLWLLGGVARLRGEPARPVDELLFALAGPAVTAVLLAVFAGAWLLAPGGGWLDATFEYQVLVNATILVFNLLPAFPLDGGRVARALLWRIDHDRVRATNQAAAAGRAFAVLLAAAGVLAIGAGLLTGVWFLLIAAFLYVAGDAEARVVRLEAALGGRRVADIAVPPICLPASATIAQALETGFAAHRFTSFPVIDADGRALGLLTLEHVRAVDPASRAWRTAGELADRDPQLRLGADEPAVAALQRPAFARVGRAVVVDADGRPIGLLSRTDVERTLRVGDVAGDHDHRLQPH